MTKLILNADDFGYSKGINLGILEAHQEGILSSTTLMVNMPAAKHAFQLAKANEKLGVGIHFVLDLGFPVSEHVPSLVDEHGRFLKENPFILHAEPEEIKKELISQLEKFLSFGLTPTHIDSHHHIHRHEKIFPIVCELAETYQLPVRPTSVESSTVLEKKGIKKVEYFNPDFFGDELDINYLKTMLADAKKYNTVEIMTHPGYIDYPVLTGSSYNTQRAIELAILTAPEIKQYIQENNINLITYREI
ncbi:chitin disaccharide deacetylase [Ornithinibacillus halotolerans]|uniref:Carbohydrate deacetylase n=1 Tax=Ornithinibacillus halotolerans TaxID=1274357 RepID=A0A916S447_9BACI|nr:chitin disaccharide deacetylase [Ornithinibacillus halotolerans]GGA79907.1 carbohydrate deacetylase [Ornithinibacillus halotolerans]